MGCPRNCLKGRQFLFCEVLLAVIWGVINLTLLACRCAHPSFQRLAERPRFLLLRVSVWVLFNTWVGFLQAVWDLLRHQLHAVRVAGLKPTPATCKRHTPSSDRGRGILLELLGPRSRGSELGLGQIGCLLEAACTLSFNQSVL